MSDFDKLYSKTPTLHNSVIDMRTMTQILLRVIKLTQQISCPRAVLDVMGDICLILKPIYQICLTNLTSQHQCVLLKLCFSYRLDKLIVIGIMTAF